MKNFEKDILWMERNKMRNNNGFIETLAHVILAISFAVGACVVVAQAVNAAGDDDYTARTNSIVKMAMTCRNTLEESFIRAMLDMESGNYDTAMREFDVMYAESHNCYVEISQIIPESPYDTCVQNWSLRIVGSTMAFSAYMVYTNEFGPEQKLPDVFDATWLDWEIDEVCGVK